MQNEISSRFSIRKFKYVGRSNGKTVCCMQGAHVTRYRNTWYRNTWKLGIIEELIIGRDRIVRAEKMRTGKGILERAVQ